MCFFLQIDFPNFELFLWSGCCTLVSRLGDHSVDVEVDRVLGDNVHEDRLVDLLEELVYEGFLLELLLLQRILDVGFRVINFERLRRIVVCVSLGLEVFALKLLQAQFQNLLLVVIQLRLGFLDLVDAHAGSVLPHDLKDFVLGEVVDNVREQLVLKIDFQGFILQNISALTLFIDVDFVAKCLPVGIQVSVVRLV